MQKKYRIGEFCRCPNCGHNHFKKKHFTVEKTAILGLVLLFINAGVVQATLSADFMPPKYTILQANFTQILTFQVNATNKNSGNLSVFYDFDYLLPADFAATWDSDPLEIAPNSSKVNSLHVAVPGNFYGQAVVLVSVKDTFDNSSIRQRFEIEVQKIPEVLPITPNITFPGFNLTFPILNLPSGQNCTISLDQQLLLGILQDKEESLVCKNTLAECRNTNADLRSRSANYDSILKSEAVCSGDLRAATGEKDLYKVLLIILIVVAVVYKIFIEPR